MYPLILWIGFLVMVIILLLIDLVFVHKKDKVISIRAALGWTLFWFFLAMVFNGFIYVQYGADSALKFFTGYLIEKALSVDNLFVILVIFTSFKIAPKFQHRVLFFGILGALVMRGITIFVGTALIERFAWILYICGVFLIFTGFKMLVKREEEWDPHESWIVGLIKRFTHVSRRNDVHHFFVYEKKKRCITLLMVALLVIEFSDLVFALDSIPAIFAITTDTFIVFTSNVFAILGLRSLFFVIARAHDIFHHLNIGLAFILMFVGAKMVAEPWIHISIGLSLGVIVGVLAICMATSLVHHKHPNDKFQKSV